MEEQRIDISKYLKFLSKEGWSDLIDERWKEDVKKELLSIIQFKGATVRGRSGIG